MEVVVNPVGQVRYVYDETLDLASLGPLRIARASHVEPDDQGRWWADLSPVTGPNIGPFRHRSEALEAERRWLHFHWLPISGASPLA